MTERNNDPFESELLAAFAREAGPVSDEGFTRRVMRSIRRRHAVRLVVLGAAWIAGGLLAGVTAASLVPDVAGAIAAVAGGWMTGDWPDSYGTVVVAVLGGAASIALGRMLED